MVENGADSLQDRLSLRSDLSEMKRLPPWIESVAARHAIPEKLKSAMDLCLEEAVSNVIRHGYAGRVDGRVAVSFSMPGDGSFVFTVEDDAPRFNPLDAPRRPALKEGGEIRIGGQGIALLRRFADCLQYEPTSGGNRLRMSFSHTGAADRVK